MASTHDFVQHVVDQIDADCEMTFRKMFGEYGIYSRGTIVALICDDRLFVKPTEAGRDYIGTPTEAPAYPGAKHSFLIEDRIDDGPWLSELIRITRQHLPPPRPRRKKKRRG